MALTKNQVEHREYLQTPQWKALRARALDRDNHICQRCKKKRACQVHHLTYERWKNENLEDLQSLCAGCHIKVHKLDKNTRKVKGKNKNNHKHQRKPKSIRKDVHIYITKVLSSKEFVRMDKAARKLLYPHPMEILEHFEFRGKTYQEKFNDITQKWFHKEDLAQKLRTMDSVFAKYRARIESFNLK